MNDRSQAPHSAPDRWLRLLLRFGGVVMVCAFPTMAMPTEWMAATHAWLGLGEYPRAAIVDYLARSIAALYGFHGVLLLILATDVVRYRPLVTYVAIMNMTFGAAMLAIDLYAGMPLLWTAFEGPPIAAMGVVLLMLNRAAAR